MTLDQELRSGFIVQCRVIAALMLREVHTINGNSKLGYLWVLVQSAFSIAVFWGLREFMNAHAPHGYNRAGKRQITRRLRGGAAQHDDVTGLGVRQNAYGQGRAHQ